MRPSVLEQYKFGTVGKALPGTEIRIAADGEILVKGPHIFREYFNDAAATREAIDPEGWFHTGDIGTLDEDGFLRITDRKKDIIVTSGGKNIAPQNVENLLKNDRYVSQAFVYGDRRKYLTALLTLAPEEIVAWAARQGIPDRGVEALAKHPEVLRLMRERIDEVNRGLASFEQVKKFALLGTDFSQETGELTPTLKVRRNRARRVRTLGGRGRGSRAQGHWSDGAERRSRRGLWRRIRLRRQVVCDLPETTRRAEGHSKSDG